MTQPLFWQNFPKALEATREGIRLALFPGEFADVHEIQGGEQKTHTFFVAFGPDPVTTEPLAWCRDPLVARAEPSWCCDSGAVPYLLPARDADAAYERLVNAAIDGDQTFEQKREVIDEYGWRHFGDIYGDHEAVRRTDPRPLVSHYNNQYDAVAGFAFQFLRTGDLRWRTLMEELASHVIDIDIYHTARDKAAYNGGLFWHTYHYTDADTATHRTYPRATRTGGGGPSSEHNYTTGLMHYYFLTGDEAAREAVIGLARWVVHMDDGRRTVLRWLSAERTGLATASGSFLYHGPGRGAGNSVNALLDGHRLAPNEGFLEKAEELIRRVIHPADDVDGRDLLDVERKWFYTIFLQSLGKYLDFKSERLELDERYAYGRASLLHYARWMAAHEYPYLEKPELLEYPTESWAAQEIRKTEVFDYATLHAGAEERSRFQERAAFFFSYAVTKLGSLETRSLARPLVIMLTNGFRHQYFLEHPDVRAPTPAAALADVGAPRAFVPQKVHSKRRLARLGVLAGGVVVAVGTLLIWLFVR